MKINGQEQEVHQGVTRSGTPGLFTGNLCAWPFFGIDVDVWNGKTHEQRVAWCDRMGFKLTGETHNI